MTFSSGIEDLASCEDSELLSRAAREPELFSVLVKRYEDAFLRRAKRVLTTQEDAEEAVQDTFVRIYLYADRYTPHKGATFASWAYTILNNVLYTAYQKKKRRWGHEAHLEPEHYEALPDTSELFVDRLSMRNEVAAVLAKLPETAARVLRAQFLEGKTQEEIASEEGTSVSAIKTRTHRAKKLFKKIHTTHS